MKYLIVLCVFVTAVLAVGCSNTSYNSRRYVVNENAEAVLTDEIRIGHTKLLVFDSKTGLAADLFDGSAVGVKKIVTDPDEKAIAPMTSAIIDAIKGVNP